MAVITPTVLPKFRDVDTKGVYATLTKTTLGASDTLVFAKGTRQILVLRNPTGGTISPVIDGDVGTSWPVEGAGGKSVALGYPAVAITAGQIKLIPLDTIEAYIQGNITITSGVGLIASIINPVP